MIRRKARSTRVRSSAASDVYKRQEVVLRELDQLKRKRTDRRVRYHGRKATRMLFEASRGGRLLDGVTLVNGSLLRVDPGRDFEDAPPELDLSRGDDQILA